ncbi:MAG: GNAT family N-acetyltransferase [Xanthobacteraceae bacterium]
MTPSKRRAAVKLRRGRRSDLDALAALEREIFASHIFAGHIISRASFRRLLVSPSAAFILAQAGIKAGAKTGAQRQLAGYALVLYRVKSGAARIYSIGVAARFRRRGLARLLVAAAEKDAVARRRKAMRLEVRADDRGTLALYESSGYRSVGRALGYYAGVDALRLEKVLGEEPRQRS